MPSMIARTVERNYGWLDDGKRAGNFGVKTFHHVKIRIGGLRIAISWRLIASVHDPCVKCGHGKAFRYAENYGNDGFEDEDHVPYVWQYCPKCDKHYDITGADD